MKEIDPVTDAPRTSLAADVGRARTAFWWVGVIVPVGMLLIAVIIVLAWYPELPDPVATHWGADGVDGFGPRWTIFVPALIGLVMVVAFAVFALFAHHVPAQYLSGGGGVIAAAEGTPRWSMTARMLGAMNLGLAGMLAVLTVITSDVQRGIADARDAPNVTVSALLGIGLLLVLGVIGWFLQPKVATPAPRDVSEGTAGVPLTASERAAWFGTAAIARGGRIVLGALWAITAGIAVFILAAGDSGSTAWILVATTLFTLVAIACSLIFRVRVSAAGLRVRSVTGWPNTRIPLDDVAKVAVVHVNPFSEFGGWGWRWGTDGRRGVVLRTGEALQVTRANGRVFVVTVDGAAEAAAVLETLSLRSKDNRS